MRAVVYSSGGRVEVADVERPRLLDPADAIVRVTLSGICGTDLHLVRDDFGALETGAVVGHEFVGEVVEIGAAVRSLRVGDRVCGADFCACGLCRWCARGEHWECAERRFFGSGRAFGPEIAGTQAELVRVPFADVTLGIVPAGCSDEAAILVCDNLPTGWAAIDFAGVEPGETVAILGGGPIGQLAAQCAQTVGASSVVLIEPAHERRRFASARGSIAIAPDESPAVIRELTSGDGADVVIEAVGNIAALDAAFALIRKRGRIVSVAAHAAPAWPFPLAAAFTREISLRFAIGDSIRYRNKLFALIVSGVLAPDDVVQDRVAFADAPRAYERMISQQILKAVIDPRR